MRLLILGTGWMAQEHARQFSAIDGVDIVGAVDLDPARVGEFADGFNIPNRFTVLEEALQWGAFDAVANVTPDRIHHPTTMQLIAAGKPVLCEKPLAENFGKAIEMAEAAEKAGIVNMVNLTYRNVAALQKARRMVQAGEIGTVRHVEASYLQSWLVSKFWGDWRSDPKWLWRLSLGHGSNGVLGDVGIHILDFASYGAALGIDHVFCRLRSFDKAPGNRIGDYGLDANDSFAMTVDFSNGAFGVVHASRWATGHLNELRLRIYGDRGGLEVVHNLDGSSLKACLGENVDDGIWEELDAGTVATNYQRFADAVRTGVQAEPSFRHAAELQKVLDLAVVSDEKRAELAASAQTR
ncbi:MULTISPECIES: Gfo/Idh/MocA family oxidoreductase [unclassified Mesorhizobium]|uniref:Gfo/Idh/MocA family protein n=1 Tax=unclassified Mesorhizobium TaxID=325217 RepID=UPI00112AC7C6|nr:MULTISPECIES: Gfo/Idh/MocA family oxidoreductase [unclassified Mesorhizobium]TPK50369.1 Gfo/Idh/MocA family oxidoreductase [Mesorhizobium sp. B2-5-2]TPL18977.1 Gfo/Idh/MocA family oxidoreductase [Mesorhizobium sp. B2-4-9]TPL19199.1 Gfo/Idh/MocA family oxidoreductase [Mesorhizobium sp. B2-4-7]TPL34461.1 Gfo/Idh/MocA family oxidoreductase [Mesorhizobium sp. B2-4-5]TPM68815.1 Gfo/Idh/MocA family oxidoreductase [Mesorhizobium sp. B2-1-6]